jgi:nucleoid DNA-binding protein
MKINNKPVTISVKTFLIRRMTQGNILMPQETIEAVVNHQFKGVMEAMKTNKSVEISGFGKFVFNERLAKHYMDRLLSGKQRQEEDLEKNNLNDKQRVNLQVKLKGTLNNIEVLKPKML